MECPVSGSIAAVHAGNLVGFAGGDAATITRALPLLVQLCRRVEHVGMLGAGARMKLAANLLLVVFWQALGESLLLADPTPGDAARALDVLADSNIGASILRTRGAEIVAAMNGTADGISAFDVDTMRKDLGYMVGEAGSRGMSLALAQRTLDRFDLASREGKGGLDGAAYPAYYVAQQMAAARRPAGLAAAR
jgi:3-hydroxyisobutyrate dehydrogenase